MGAQAATHLPSYDTGAYCESVSQAVGGSYQIKARCIADEAAARDAARSVGPVGERIERYCAKVESAVGGSYAIYGRCLLDERSAQRSLP